MAARITAWIESADMATTKAPVAKTSALPNEASLKALRHDLQSAVNVVGSEVKAFERITSQCLQALEATLAAGEDYPRQQRLLADQRARLEALVAENDAWAEQCTPLRASVAALQASVQALEARLQEVRDVNAALQVAAQAREQQLVEARDANAALTRDRDAALALAAESEERVAALQRELDAHHRATPAANGAVAAAVATVLDDGPPLSAGSMEVNVGETWRDRRTGQKFAVLRFTGAGRAVMRKAQAGARNGSDDSMVTASVDEVVKHWERVK